MAGAEAIAAAASAAGGVAQNIAGAIFQGATNKKNRQFQEHMYDKSRQDALADWNMQNEYNSPKAQMQRLQDANLNPDLVYGGGGFSPTAAGVPRSASSGDGTAKAFQPDMSFVGQSLMNYYNIKQANAQTDNLVANNTVITMDALLKAAQVLNTNADTASKTGDVATKQFNLDQAKQLSPYVIEVAKKQVDKLNADIDYTLSNTEMQRLQGESSIRKAAEEILNLRMARAVSSEDIAKIKEQVRLLNTDNEIRKLDLEAYKNGIRPTDSIGARIIGRLIGPDFIDKIKSTTKDIKMVMGKSFWSPERQKIRDSIYQNVFLPQMRKK